MLELVEAPAIHDICPTTIPAVIVVAALRLAQKTRHGTLIRRDHPKELNHVLSDKGLLCRKRTRTGYRYTISPQGEAYIASFEHIYGRR